VALRVRSSPGRHQSLITSSRAKNIEWRRQC
jgi:hypothetical protein